MGVSACTDPYDPGQRAVGGGLLGASAGAAIGGIAGGGRGAATGALIGGTLGALGGAATTPSPDYYGYGSSASGYNRYGSYESRCYGSGYNGYGSYGPHTTDLATMELATTDTVDRNAELPTRRSPSGVPHAERPMKRPPTNPTAVGGTAR
jgi:hypothetical protein